MFILWSAWACQKAVGLISGHRQCRGTKCLRRQCGSEVTLVQLGSLLPWIWMTSVAPKRIYPRTYLPTYLPTRLYDITTQKMGLSLHLLSSCCVMYRLLLNRREGLSSTLMACAWSCSESLALSKVVLSLHATRFNSQACLFQWLSLATVLIALPHLELLADAVRGITTEHRWNTRCLNLELLGSNCS